MSSVQEEDNNDANLMIQVTKAWKAYGGSQYILKDLSISVPKGSIYSLLGSSGVGKTTLLNAIIGNICLDSGSIRVGVNSRLEIGYMPQELALYVEMTLKEIFKFFGIILHMSNHEITDRTKELIQILQLPRPETQISTLSGGQRRRVSLAVAMLKDPDLLILDEPTANLDPLLKHSIWNYLYKISQDKKKTILLTTHYIEEAKNSDKVGFLAGGRVLLEGNPVQVLNYTQPPSECLEEVYHQLCSRNALQGDDVSEPRMCKSKPNIFAEPVDFSYKRVLALVLKAIFYIRRNLLIFYLFIFSPPMLLMMLSLSLNRPKDLKLGYVNYEANCTAGFLNCSTPLSCRYMDNLKEKDFHLVSFDSVEEGIEGVKENKVWGMVKFNWNFSAAVINRLDYFYAVEPVEVADDDEARVWLDMSAHPISYMIKKHFYDSFLKSIEDWYTDCGWNARSAHPFMREEEPVYGEVDESLITSVIPTNLVIMVVSVGMALGLIFIVSDRELGTFERCRVPGLKISEHIVADFIICFCSLLATGLVLILIMELYSGPYNSPVGWTAVVMILQISSGILIGIVIGLMTTNLGMALQVTIGIIAPLTYVSGCLWPYECFHWIVKIVYYVSPGFIPGGSLRVMASKGFVGKELIWAIAHSIVWILLTVIILGLIVKRREKK